MNYIIHLNTFLDKMLEEEWVVAHHYSLYMALFNIWNKTCFKKIITIRKNDMMKAARISSGAAYYRCLKDLEAAQLLKFYPSPARSTPASVEMIPLGVSVQTPSLKHNNKNKQSNGPELDDVLKFFSKQGYSAADGSRFWYHYQAADWKSGHTPVMNWRALAHKWVANIKITKHDQNYDEPF